MTPSLEQFGIQTGQGRRYEEIAYVMALVYHKCNTHIAAFLKKHNLSIGKFNILVVIKWHGKGHGLSQVDISKHLIVTPSNMTKMLDKLEKEGLVVRSAMPNDRRVNLINVTKTASKLLDDIWEEYNENLKDLMSGLNEKDQEVLSAKLIKWLNALL